MRFLLEYLIVTLAFWIVSTRMVGIVMKRSGTVFSAALIYLFSYAFFKWLIATVLYVLSLGLMIGVGLLSSIFGALAAMYMVTWVLDDYKIDSFGTLAAAVLVISVLAAIFRIFLL